jgi:hypothetical protein
LAIRTFDFATNYIVAVVCLEKITKVAPTASPPIPSPFPHLITSQYHQHLKNRTKIDKEKDQHNSLSVAVKKCIH